MVPPILVCAASYSRLLAAANDNRILAIQWTLYQSPDQIALMAQILQIVRRFRKLTAGGILNLLNPFSRVNFH
jgi:hypothetical protein